jgi:hypothetical protein
MSTDEQDDDRFLKNQKKCLIYLKKLAEVIKAQNIENCYQESRRETDTISKSEMTVNL